VTDPRFTLRVMSTLGLQGVVTEMTPMLTRRGLDFSATYGATNVLTPRIMAGEAADVLILTDTGIEALMQRGTVASGSRRDLARWRCLPPPFRFPVRPASCDRAGGQSVRVIDDEADPHGRPANGLWTDVECPRILIYDEERLTIE